ncbi:MAG: bifunctional 4-hydroxy-3-methylbut-2-enyl diphosphate reductase/30S ribosomal protein S1 [bacterium]|jgi:ribosomal protein S1/(E)-4-hydroxy-3-methyl-but-2-enyl pyrophosphate reductase
MMITGSSSENPCEVEALEIILAKKAGFCFGVKRALALAGTALQKGEKPLYTYGPLVHNQNVVSRLRSQGVQVAQDLSEINGGRVIIRAHGIPPGDFAAAADKGLTIIDATCPFVKRAQNLAQELNQEGYQVVIIGERDHAEVKALQGWAGGKALVLENKEEAVSLPFHNRIGVIVQTTQSQANVDMVLSILKTKAADLKIHNTICFATQERQEEASTLAKRVDVMIIVGSKSSANTNRLFDICSAYTPRAVLVESAREIRPEWFRNARRVGITAGASTPDWLIKEVVEKMEEIKKENELQETGEANAENAATEPQSETPETVDAPVNDATETAADETKAPTAEAGEEQPAEEDKENEVMNDYEETFRNLREGEIVKGTVMSVSHDEVLVDVGYKSEGVIPISELSHQWVDNPDAVVNKGDVIEVYIVSVEDNEGKLILSKKRAEEGAAWERLQAAFDAGATVRGTVREAVKGGLLVDVGLSGFVPASQVDRRYVKDLSEYVGQEHDFAVIELDQTKRRAVLSRRKVLEESIAKQREETLAELEEGQAREGIVKSLTTFGAFIDLGGVDGLLHISEMSWGHVGHPSEVLNVGDKIKVMVLSIDRERNRIGLGLKQVLPDPWSTLTEKYPVGAVVTGKVVRLVKFGAFVELEPGIDGLIHISRLATRHVNDPAEVVTPGDMVQVKIVSVKPDEKRIGLSMSDLEQSSAPAKEPEDNYEVYTDNSNSGGVTIGEMFEAKNNEEEKA